MGTCEVNQQTVVVGFVVVVCQGTLGMNILGGFNNYCCRLRCSRRLCR